MPIGVRSIFASGQVYSRPFVGKAAYPSQISVNISALTSAEVDIYGYLKPGVPFTAAGVLAGASATIHGVVPEPLNVLNLNITNPATFAAALAAAGTQQVAVITIGQVNRAIIEANLGRVLTANELAAFVAAGCLIKLL